MPLPIKLFLASTDTLASAASQEGLLDGVWGKFGTAFFAALLAVCLKGAWEDWIRPAIARHMVLLKAPDGIIRLTERRIFYADPVEAEFLIANSSSFPIRDCRLYLNGCGFGVTRCREVIASEGSIDKFDLAAGETRFLQIEFLLGDPKLPMNRPRPPLDPRFKGTIQLVSITTTSKEWLVDAEWNEDRREMVVRVTERLGNTLLDLCAALKRG